MHGAAPDRAGRRLEVRPGRHQAGRRLACTIVAAARLLEVAHDLGEAEHAHRRPRRSRCRRTVPGCRRSCALRRSRGRSRPSTAAGPIRIMAIALRTEPLASTTAKIRPSTISEKYSAGPNSSASAGQRRAERRDQHGRDAAGEERADRGDRERRTGAALPGHLVAVERRHHRRRLAGNVDQDRRGRAAVLRAVVDAGEHDQRADRRQAEGDRQQHRDGGERADARQHADQRADERADQAQARCSSASARRRSRARDCE